MTNLEVGARLVIFRFFLPILKALIKDNCKKKGFYSMSRLCQRYKKKKAYVKILLTPKYSETVNVSEQNLIFLVVFNCLN